MGVKKEKCKVKISAEIDKILWAEIKKISVLKGVSATSLLEEGLKYVINKYK